MNRREARQAGRCQWGYGRKAASAESAEQEPVCGDRRAAGDAAYCAEHRQAAHLPASALGPREARAIASFYAWKDRQGQVVR